MKAGLPKTVGLTGGIGAGKSEVRRLFEALGVPCLDADVVAREIHQDPGSEALAKIRAVFPQAVGSGGTLRRGGLLEHLAAHPEANTRLIAILKPYVLSRMHDWRAAQRHPYVVWESALIAEAKVPVTRILAVHASRPVRLARVMARNPGWSEEQIQAVMALQARTEAASDYADDTIDNAGSVADLNDAVAALHRRYLELWSGQ